MVICHIVIVAVVLASPARISYPHIQFARKPSNSHWTLPNFHISDIPQLLGNPSRWTFLFEQFLGGRLDSALWSLPIIPQPTHNGCHAFFDTQSLTNTFLFLSKRRNFIDWTKETRSQARYAHSSPQQTNTRTSVHVVEPFARYAALIFGHLSRILFF